MLENQSNDNKEMQNERREMQTDFKQEQNQHKQTEKATKAHKQLYNHKHKRLKEEQCRIFYLNYATYLPCSNNK